MNFENLLISIEQTHTKLSEKAISQINYYNTLRNWLIGYFIVEFEQYGEDRAVYGSKVLKKLASELMHIKGMSVTNLKLFRQFYRIYPEIGQTVSDQFKQMGLPSISQTMYDQLIRREDSVSFLSPQELLTQLNFSHFIELIRVQDASKRHFYELEAVKNAWKVRDLARAIDTLLFERTGLSVNKAAVVSKIRKSQKIEVKDVQEVKLPPRPVKVPQTLRKRGVPPPPPTR